MPKQQLGPPEAHNIFMNHNTLLGEVRTKTQASSPCPTGGRWRKGRNLNQPTGWSLSLNSESTRAACINTWKAGMVPAQEAKNGPQEDEIPRSNNMNSNFSA